MPTEPQPQGVTINKLIDKPAPTPLERGILPDNVISIVGAKIPFPDSPISNELLTFLTETSSIDQSNEQAMKVAKEILAATSEPTQKKSYLTVMADIKAIEIENQQPSLMQILSTETPPPEGSEPEAKPIRQIIGAIIPRESDNSYWILTADGFSMMYSGENKLSHASPGGFAEGVKRALKEAKAKYDKESIEADAAIQRLHSSTEPSSDKIP